MPRYLCRLQYDGKNYCGWQIQKNALSVQQILQEKIAIILGYGVTIHGSSRTDAGVHARGQLIFFDVEPLKKNLNSFFKSFNALLPRDIRIIEILEVDSEFNPRRINKGKLYQYNILNAAVQDVFWKDYAWWVIKTLDLQKMEAASKVLLGKRDFSAFCGKNAYRSNPIKKIEKIEIQTQPLPCGNLLSIRIFGDSFLKQMVRIMVGTLVEIGLNRLDASVINQAFAEKKREILGRTAPAAGLFLEKIFLDEQDL